MTTNPATLADTAPLRNLSSESDKVEHPSGGSDLHDESKKIAGETISNIQNASDRVGARVDEAGGPSALKQQILAERSEQDKQKEAELDAKREKAMDAVDKL